VATLLKRPSFGAPQAQPANALLLRHHLLTLGRTDEASVQDDQSLVQNPDALGVLAQVARLHVSASLEIKQKLMEIGQDSFPLRFLRGEL
jgi:hypothetical protein